MAVNKTKIEFILLAICTYKRPNMLKNAISSAKLLIVPKDIKIEMLVVDNDIEQSAKNCIEKIRNEIPFKINYVAEGKRGLSNARNRVLEEAVKLGATHISMYDDDEILTAETLAAHIRLYKDNPDCLISSGIVLNKFSPNTPRYIENNLIFKHKTTKKTGQIKSSCASGNVFIPVEMIKSNNDLRFSIEFQFMGGEDGEFFSRASKKGYTIVQNTDSLIWEDVSKERSTLKYVLKRAYYNGYSGSYLKFKDKKSFGKIFPYITKFLFVILLNLICLIPSLLFGFTAFINVLSMCAKTSGKICGAVNSSPFNFYGKIYGS